MKDWTNIIMLKGLLSKNWALLKSDHFGIEISPLTLHKKSITMLKSDHFGIEMVMTIRPYPRNWRLKSDHFGIEITTRESYNSNSPSS